MQIINQATGQVISPYMTLANTFWSRLKGLLGRSSLGEGESLALLPCSSVHTFFMKFPIDVVFLNPKGSVIHLEENLKPWRCSKLVRQTHMVIELPIGTISSSRIKLGDTLAIR